MMSHPRLRYAAAWYLALVLAGDRLWVARHAFDNRPPDQPDRHRPDGNDGHAQIDFGGQWVFARMVTAGYADRLYDRNALWQVVRAAYPRSAASPWVVRESFPKAPGIPPWTDDDPRYDDEWMMFWFMGSDSPGWDEAGRAVALPFAANDPFGAAALQTAAADRLTPGLVAEVNRKRVGGPLYPPVQAFLYAPLALTNSPQQAYFAFQWVYLAFTFLTGLGVSVLSRGRIWWPVATAAVMLYPGYRSGLELGQNPVITLAVLVWGWAFVARGRDGWGGIVWGLLVFKPVWAAAFFLVPLLQRRWRFCGAMVLTATGLAAATLPVVGLHTWLDWLAVGKEGSDLYLVNKNWIGLSRDLFGIPRRALIDFTRPMDERGSPAATLIGWLLWGVVFAVTVSVGATCRDRRPTGLTAGFLALVAFLCCYRFMYYDVLLSFLGVALLFAEWDEFIPPVRPPGWRGRWTRFEDATSSVPVVIFVSLVVLENWLLRAYYQIEVPGLPGPPRAIGTGVRYPWDTVLVLLLWAWAGRKVVSACRGIERWQA